MSDSLVSVVIATHHKASYLARTLRSLYQQTEQRFHVVVASDTGGTLDTSTEEVYASVSHLIDIFLIHVPSSDGHPRGAATARNFAIRHAEAPRVLIIDDDCLCPPSLVATHAALPPDVGGIGLRRHLTPEQYEVFTTDFSLLESVPHRKEVRDNVKTRRNIRNLILAGSSFIHQHTFTCHLSLPTAILQKIGGFWEAMRGSGHEDREMGLRAFRAGLRYHFIEDVAVYHQDHPRCPLQGHHAPVNLALYRQTRNDSSIITRNGGALA